MGRRVHGYGLFNNIQFEGSCVEIDQTIDQKELAGFPLHLENLENLEKWEYTWKTWKYHGILKNVVNIMEKMTWNLEKLGGYQKFTQWLPWNNTKFTKVERKVY